MRISAVFSGEKPVALAARFGPTPFGALAARSGPASPERAVRAYLLSALLNWSRAQAYAVGATLDQYFQLWLSPVSRW